MIISLTLYAMGFVTQVFSSCKSGQNLKDAVSFFLFKFLTLKNGILLKFQVVHLADTVSTGPWDDLGIASSLNLVVIELQRSFSAKGGPFFTFNFEFFAQIMGAVFTYFIILVQIKE